MAGNIREKFDTLNEGVKVMGLQPAKMHYWLYNKIQWAENMENSILSWGREQGLPVDEWSKRIRSLFGDPLPDKPLEELIDSTSIQDWLQSRIQSAELRQAALITQILKYRPDLKDKLRALYESLGRLAGERGEPVESPESAYYALKDIILEGIPCGTADEVLRCNPREFAWKTKMCMHKPYWDQVQGDVEHFYYLRKAWIDSFVSAVNPSLRYEWLPDSTHKIVAGITG